MARRDHRIDRRPSVIFCDACGRVSTADQRRAARLEASRVGALSVRGVW